MRSFSVIVFFIMTVSLTGCESRLDQVGKGQPSGSASGDVEKVVELDSDANKAGSEIPKVEKQPNIFEYASSNLTPHLTLISDLEITDDIPVTSNKPFLSTEIMTVVNVTVVSFSPHEADAQGFSNGEVEFSGFDAVFKIINPRLPGEVKIGDLTISIYSGSLYVVITDLIGNATIYVGETEVSIANEIIVRSDLTALNTALINAI
jgi:hypothetical protein